MKMCLNVMLNLGILWLDISRNIQVVVVAHNLVPFHQSAIVADGLLCVPSIHDPFDVLLSQTVFRAVFLEAILRIDEEDTLTAVLVLFIDDDDGCRNTCTKENVWRQSDDTFDIVLLDDMLADVVFSIATEQHTMRQDAGTTAFVCFHRGNKMEQESIVATLGRGQQVGSPAVVLVILHA